MPHTWVCGLHLAVVSEAMVRLSSLLRTERMLGGDEANTLFSQLERAMDAVRKELTHAED
jgi:hypothetical protein